MGNTSRVHSSVSCLVSIVAILTILQPCRGLVISELMYHPADTGETLEFIELYNNQPTSEDLGGFAFTNGVQYTFPAGTMLGPKKYLVVARNPDALQAAHGITGVYGPYSGKLDNAGERIELSNANRGIVLSMRYRSESPWPVAPDGTGHSLILVKLAGDPDEGSSYSSSTFVGGTPGRADESQVEPEAPQQATLVDIGDAGRYFKGSKEPSPAADGTATTAWTQIAFNDDPAATAWRDGPSGYGYSNDQAELQYIRTQLNDMNGGYMSVYARLRFTLTAAQIASFDRIWAEVHYDDAYVLYLNGTRVGDSGNISGTPPVFSQAAGTASDYPAANVDLTSRLNLLVAGTNVLAIQVHNCNLSNSSDCICSPVLKATMKTTSASDATRHRIVINELQAAPGVGRFELYNHGPLTVDLHNLYLSNDPLHLLAYRIPSNVTLRPGEFWTIAEGYAGTGFPFALDPAGGAVYITASTSDADARPLQVMDAVRYGAMEPNQTFGRFPNGADAFDFLTSPTFGGSNAKPAIGPVVINEIMYHHPTQDDRYEFIELYNRSSTAVPLSGWTLADAIDYTFGPEAQLPPGGYVVVAKDPNFLAQFYPHLLVGSNLFGPCTGTLNDCSDRIRLYRPAVQTDPQSGRLRTSLILADEVTYHDSGLWPVWADGDGASLELRDPDSDNNVAGAWAASDERAKTQWQPFSMTIDASDPRYTHDTVNVFDFMLLTRGEVLLDDLEMIVNGVNVITNGGFENEETGWRIIGNHVQSFVTPSEPYSGQRCLHLVATGHGDPGANRINQSVSAVTAGTVTFRGNARWLCGSRFLLMRASRALAPVQPPRPSWAFELAVPANLGTPGQANTALSPGRGPDILDVRHTPVAPAPGQPIIVTTRVVASGSMSTVRLSYKSEGDATSTGVYMVDDGSGDDQVAGDGVYTATMPGAAAGAMRSFNIQAFDGSNVTSYPPSVESSPKAISPRCVVRVGDTAVTTTFATYRIWLSDASIHAFKTRASLSNELTPCTFVYNDTEVFYNAQIRFRASPFLRNGTGWDPRDRHAYRLEFGGDQTFRGRKEVNLDSTESTDRGPLQERASYWFFRQLGMPYSTQEFVRVIINGSSYANYEDVQVLNGDYIERWFPDDSDGYLHKCDDYFEYAVDGSTFATLEEGLKYDAQHPLLNETHRWGFEKRSHSESDNWDHVFQLVVSLNASSSSARYETAIESVIHPEHFARILAVQHAVGNWDSYGYRRGKNSYFYLAANEGKWYLLPWDIDFTLGNQGDEATHSIFDVRADEFPEVYQFINYPRYRQLYLQAMADLVNGPWKTSYGTPNPPTTFDQFLDDAANALIGDGLGSDRRDGIKQFVRDRRAYLLTQIPASLIK
jgi:hypothetical protein